jgi:tRNA A37 methylthiotransferase MiaB
MNRKLYMVSLGCSKNLVDSEVMLGLLEKDGYQVTSKPEDADLLLINTGTRPVQAGRPGKKTGGHRLSGAALWP